MFTRLSFQYWCSRSLLRLSEARTRNRCIAAAQPAQVDAKRIVEADKDPGNWMTHGRTYDEQRYSARSTQIDAGNVKQLGLAWYADLDTDRGQEATPLVVDGVLYVTTAVEQRATRIDAATGKLLWRYDPKVAGDKRRQGLLRHRQPRRRRLEGQDLSSARSTAG